VRAGIVIFVLASGPAHAAVIDVATPDELATAIANAGPGDEIVLADGTYALAANVSCAATGTAEQPIVVRAANPLGARIELDALEGFKVTGAHWHFEGLDVHGVCADDNNCEHAFHVSGAADGFVLRGSRVVDFNAQLKVNASQIGGTFVTPKAGLVENCHIFDTRGRNTGNPVTKLNIDTGDDWIVRGNFLHDGQKLGGDATSYLAFMKSGGNRGLFERNLVVCSRDTTGGTRIGLSFGGGGTAPQFCAPAFDAGTPCAIEHEGGTMRNNIIASCSDVGIYINRGHDSHVLFNTIIDTAGVDFRFDTTTGEAVGNVLGGMIRPREGGTVTATDNLDGIDLAMFETWYRDPRAGDLVMIGDLSPLIGAGPARADVTDDYCAQARPSGALTMGAIEHSVGGCYTAMPPDDPDPEPPPGDDPTSEAGCCRSSSPGAAPWLAIIAFALLRRARARAPRA
jgi:hypothetical protein